MLLLFVVNVIFLSLHEREKERRDAFFLVVTSFNYLFCIDVSAGCLNCVDCVDYVVVLVF